MDTVTREFSYKGKDKRYHLATGIDSDGKAYLYQESSNRDGGDHRAHRHEYYPLLLWTANKDFESLVQAIINNEIGA